MDGRVAAVAVVVMSGLLLQGCGYQFVVDGPGPRIGSEVAMMDDETPAVWLAIRTFRNRTFHPHLEDAYTRFMRQEFTVGSGARVVADDARADYVMTGEIVSAAVSSLTFSTGETRERRVEVAVSATVTHRRTGDVAWTGTADGTGDFFVNRALDAESRQDEIQFNQVLQDRALEQAGQDAAATLATSFRDAWRQGSFLPGPPPSSASSPAPIPPSPTDMPAVERLPGLMR